MGQAKRKAERVRATRLAAEWCSFVDHLMPGGASVVQHQEMRRSFYAGARTVLSIIYREATPGDEPLEADYHMLQDIEAELAQFVADVEAGRA